MGTKESRRNGGRSKRVWNLVLPLTLVAPLVAAAPVEEQVRTNQPGILITREGRVEFLTPRAHAVAARPNQYLNFGDTLRTLELSRASVRFIDWSQFQMKDRTRLEIVRHAVGTNAPAIKLLDGELYFSSHGRDGRAVSVETPHASGVPKGTEFLVSVNAGRTEFTMFDGEVELSNPQGIVRIPSGRQGIAEAGQPPRLVPLIEARKAVQWWIYYPGVLDPSELGLSPAEQTQLADSLAAYRAGDPRRALETYPGYPSPVAATSDAQRVYLASALLCVGLVEEAQAQLTNMSESPPTSRALRTMIAAVSESSLSNVAVFALPPTPTTTSQPTASEWIALSYAHQATNNLGAALRSARQAVDRSPSFGFGWARVAELEFSFGQTGAARAAVQRAIELSPRNAQAHAVNGFLLAAQDRLQEAIASFNHAIELNPSLGNAWLGRGLCRIRQGIFTGSPTSTSIERATFHQSGLADLQTASLLEPTRSLTRSYAGKAFSEAGDAKLAMKEFAFAKDLDPDDPTPWLYDALELWQRNRPNEAIRQLERSIFLNDNRAVYRSRSLLDQDEAVRRASLAKVYQSAGLDQVALSEAAKSVSYDYANHSAHQFLAESYNALRDPTRFNLRYETVWFNELLLANLLSPVGAGLLSQNISQQEYSRLFEANRVGLLTSTEYRSDGQFREIASHYGLLGNTSYTVDLDYQHNKGTRPNNGLDRLEWYSQFKQQISPRDSFFLLTKYQAYESGDNFQHYDPADASRTLRVRESQAPIILGAFHREWRPGIHTTFLAGRLEDDFESSGPAFVFDLRTNAGPSLHSVVRRDFSDTRYENHYAPYLGEINQIVQVDKTSLITGGRVQAGRLETTTRLDEPGASTTFTNRFTPPVRSRLDQSFDRFTIYAYLTSELWSGFRLTAGGAYDHLHYPIGFRSAPVTAGTRTRDGFSPKAALTWDLFRTVTIRGFYAQTLGGVTFDDSVRLEPTQLAGFEQAFRNVISESEAGSVIAPRHELGGAAFDFRITPNTFAGVKAQWLQSRAEQRLGVFEGAAVGPPASPSSTPEQLDYRERSLALSLDRLLGNQLTLGSSYELIESRLRWSYPAIPDGTPLLLLGAGNLSRTESALLHVLGVRLGFNHPSGLFARAEARWFLQDNDGYPNPLNEARSGESLQQLDLRLGWLFARRRGELLVGCLNVTDQNYRLNSLTPFPELARERVWLGRFRWNF